MMNNFLASIHFTLRLKPFRWWMLACWISILLSAAINQAIRYLLFSPQQVSFIDTIPGVSLLSDYYQYSGGHLAISGLVLGCCQWLILRRYFNRAGSWIVFSAIGSAIATLIYAVGMYALTSLSYTYSWIDSISVFGASYYFLPPALGLGLGLGISQYLAFRFSLAGSLNHTQYWIGTVLFTQFAIALVEYAPIFNQPAPFMETLYTGQAPVAPSLFSLVLTSVFKFLLISLLQGAFTGWVLSHLIAQQKRALVAIF